MNGTMDETLERGLAYLANPTELGGEEITAFATQEEKRLIEDITSRFKRLKADGTEKALFYNQYGEALRAYETKEITEEEYKNDPLKKAYEDHAIAIHFRAMQLGRPCILRAMVNTPDYERAVDNAIKRAEKHIKNIQKATVTNAEEIAFIAGYLMPEVFQFGYILYHAQEWEQYTAFMQKAKAEYDRIQANAQGPLTEADARRINELYEAQEQKAADLASSIYKAAKAQSITEQILSRIFPEQKQATRQAIATAKRAKVLEGYKDFSAIRQGISTNNFTKLRATAGRGLTVDEVTGTATIKNGNFILTIPKYDELAGLKTSTHQLLDAITIALTESGAKNPTVILSVDDYMKRRGLKDRKEARKQLTADLGVLLKTSISWEEKRGASSIPFAGVNVTDSWLWADKKKTSVAYTFGQTFFNVLRGYPVMAYPALLQKLNGNANPNSFYLGRKITEHKNMNSGKKNENLIAVKTLLAVAQFLPSYEEVMKGNRNIQDRIITPFERDMDALEDALSWNYCHSLNEPLTDAELATMDYATFEGLLIFTSWKDYKDQTARLERKAERIAEAEKNKKRATSKKKKPAEK